MLERVTKSGFFNNQFIEVHNTATTSSEIATTRVVESIKKDSRLNGYNPEEPTTIHVPRFTFDIISCLPFASQQQSSSSSLLSPPSYGSGAFDLAQSLDLLPSQEYGLRLPMVEVEVDKVGRYDDRYCGYLSRQGLVFLASRYATRVSMHTGPSGGIVIDTSLGRFKVFEHDHRTYLNFDSGMRVPVPAVRADGQHTQPVPNMETILKAADGWCFARELYVETVSLAPKEWKEQGPVPPIKTAMLNVFQDLECSVFLPSKLAKEWELLAQFSSHILQSVALIFFDIQEPKRLVRLRDIFFERVRRKDQLFGSLYTPDDQVEEAVARWGCIVKIGSDGTEGPKALADMDSDGVEMHHLILNALVTLYKGHEKFRAATVDTGRLIETSEKRFLSLFEGYRTQPSTDRLHGELRKLLHKSENICLVLWQAVLAMITYRNACKTLKFGIESPDEWIQFVFAQDSDILIG